MANEGAFMSEMKGVWIWLQRIVPYSACWSAKTSSSDIIGRLSKVILRASFFLEDTEGLKIQS